MAKLAKNVAFYLLVLVIIVVAVFPFYYAVITSFKTGTALFQVDYWPKSISFSNYVAVFTQGSFPRNLANSLFISAVVVFLSLLLGITAAYALARVRFRGRSVILFTILSVSMFPQLAVLAGLFELVRTAGIPWVIITRVFMPLMWPALVTTGLLAFIGAWNEFLFALTFTSNNEQRTVPVAIALLSGATSFEVPWGNIMAASVIVTVPLVVLVLIFQRKIISGLTAGGVKG
jgi:trehalose/maltose transport system permease protein